MFRYTDHHLHIAGDDGCLYDTRMVNWHGNPLRRNYSWHHAAIDTVADLKATLRAGPYAWPGGYPLYFLTSDGAVLSFKAAREEFRQIAWSIENQAHDGWLIIACGINWEDPDMECSHTGEPIEAAYC